jgi:hypothetical protein
MQLANAGGSDRSEEPLLEEFADERVISLGG